MHRAVIASILIVTLFLTACNPSVDVSGPDEIEATETAFSEDQDDGPASQDMLSPVGGHEQARDVVVAYVADLAGVPLPEGEWVFQDQSDQNPGEGLTWLFTNGPWVVQVSAPAILPEPMEYTVTVDQMSAIIRWEGTVDSFGKIVETNFVRGSQPEAPEKPGEPSWVGTVVSNPPGSQYDDYFQGMDQNGTRYGIDALDDALKEQLVSFRDTGTVIQVFGVLQKDVPDMYGVQIVVTRIKPY